MLQKGFSLIEIIIVILIMAILSVLLATNLTSSLSVTKLEAAKFKLKSDIIYAQALSVTQQINHGVVFDTGLKTYSVYRQTAGNIANNPLTGAPFIVNYNTDPDLKGIDLVSADFGSPTTNRVEFNSLGVPSNGAAALTIDGAVNISYAGLNGIVTVTKNTGMVN